MQASRETCFSRWLRTFDTIALVQADFSVELGSDDETLDLPWSDEASGLRYYDLKRNPGLISKIEEAQLEPTLAEFLSSLNSSASPLETAKCDSWASADITIEEEIFGAPHKFGSYVDLIFSDRRAQVKFQAHEEFAKKICALLKKSPEIPVSAEFLIRRCYFRDHEPVRSGFYITFYLFGFGDDESQAHQRWVIGMKLVENAIKQASH